MSEKRRARLPVEIHTTTLIENVLADWRKRHAALFTAEASGEAFEMFFLERLQADRGSINTVYIVDLARRGHPAADRALRRFIIAANEQDRFQALPLSVRAYNGELLARAPATPCYPSQAPQTINNFNRDLAVGWLIEAVKRSCPDLPLLYSSNRRRSAASLVGGAFGLSEVRARRVFQAHRGLARAVAEFFLAHTNTLPNGPPPFGR